MKSSGFCFTTLRVVLIINLFLNFRRVRISAIFYIRCYPQLNVECDWFFAILVKNIVIMSPENETYLLAVVSKNQELIIKLRLEIQDLESKIDKLLKK